MLTVTLSDQQWQKILPFLRSHPNAYVGQEQDCRRFLEAVLWITRSGAQWRLLPKEYGDWNTIYRRKRYAVHVSTMCRALDVSPAGCYCWLRREPSARDREDERLVEKLRAAHLESRGTYGSPKIYRKLRRGGETVNHKRVERLMKEEGLKARRVKKCKRTTDSRHSLPVAGNVLAREFKAPHPDEVWTSDITYIRTAEGWLYLVVFLDLYSWLVVGWAVSERLEVEFVERAFLQGQARRGSAVSPLIHSDRGCQYASAAFGERLAAWGCRQSMSRKGNCWDNAVRESFFGVLKSEMIHHESFTTRREA